MNLQILRDLEAYIGQNKVEEPCMMQEETCFRQQLKTPCFVTNAIKENIENKESAELNEKLPDFSAFRRDKGEVKSENNASLNEMDACGISEPIYHECYSDSAPMEQKEQDLEDYIRKQKSKETFSMKLLQYIDLTGLTDAEIYRRAGIDRRHFSKIRCDKEYRPKKTTVLALCLALKLDKNETEELLSLAGYSLSNGDTGDLVVKFCIERGIYDLMEVNEALDYFGQKVIG